MRRGSPLQNVRSVIWVLSQPGYAAVAVVVSLAMLGILAWLFMLGTLLYVLTLPGYPIGSKLGYLLAPYHSTIFYFFQDPVVAGRAVFSVAAGMNLAAYLYIRRHADSPAGRKGIGGFLSGIVASGCVACGTSILSPLLAGAGAGASAVIGAAVSTVGFLVGILLLGYSLYGMGGRLAHERARVAMMK